jgi:spermidine/putrescine transport system permease protein
VSEALDRGRMPLVLPGLTMMVLLFAVPIVAVVLVSFLQTQNFQFIYELTVANYKRTFESLYVQVFIRSVRVAFLVATISVVIGFPVAYFLARKVRSRQLLLLMLLITPLWTSYLVRTFAWMQILGTNGLVNFLLQYLGLTEQPISWLLYSEFAVIVALVHIYMPFMILPIYAVLEKLDDRLIEAAYDLGASGLRVFITVIIPLSLPGIVTGYIFVFIPAIGAFVTPELLGGTKGLMIGSIVAQQFGATYEYPFGSALSIVLIAIILAVTIALLRLGGRRS